MERGGRTMDDYDIQIREENKEIARAQHNIIKNLDLSDTYKLFMSKLPEEAKVYDLECATGRDTFGMLQLGLQVVGLDGIQGNIDVAKEEYPWCNFILHGLMSPGTKLDKADGIWVYNSLTELTDHDARRALSRTGDYMKPGGILFARAKMRADQVIIMLTQAEYELIYYEKTGEFEQFMAQKK